MTKLRKLIKDNNIKCSEVFTMLGVSRVVFERKSGLHADFKIIELEKIKDFFINLGVVSFDYDIGDFLEEIA